MQAITDLGIILSATLMFATPLIFAAMGSLFSERSGVVNIAIEGLMVIGAFTGVAVTLATGNVWVGVLSAGLSGVLFALLHAVATIRFYADHTVSGIAINFLAPGAALFMSRFLYEGSATTPMVPSEQKLPRLFGQTFEQGSFFNNVFSNYISAYLAFALVGLTWYILYKTPLGLRLRAVGEHPKGVSTLGVNVYRMKYYGVLMSGFLAGIAGSTITLATVSAFRPTIVSGQGFIALAAVIIGKYKPKGVMLACILFGFCNALVAYIGNPRIGINISEQLLSMLPYIITLSLLLFIGRSATPAASGKPFKKE